ncbi:cytochrome c3 family protein [Deltaproteobacteria bacterium]|nr:cytochrome c3 family protein [Deltaproteobacteria bacterium]
MRKIFYLSAIGVLITLFLLQVSCSTGRYIEDSDAEVLSGMEQSGDGMSSEVEDASKRDMFLGGTHMESGIECNDCHIGESEETYVSTAVCLSCHKNFAAPAAYDVVDPHYAHMVYNNCGECHHAHRSSQNQCETCHYFNLHIP